MSKQEELWESIKTLEAKAEALAEMNKYLFRMVVILGKTLGCEYKSRELEDGNIEGWFEKPVAENKSGLILP